MSRRAYAFSPKFHRCGESLCGLIIAKVKKMSVIKVLKVFGIHIRRLSFSYDKQLPPKLYCGLMLDTCKNVINLTLLTQVPLNHDKLEKILQHLKQLKKLHGNYMVWCFIIC